MKTLWKTIAVPAVNASPETGGPLMVPRAKLEELVWNEIERETVRKAPFHLRRVSDLIIGGEPGEHLAVFEIWKDEG